jgi:hypothetical protein
MRPLPPDPVFSRSDMRACGWSDSAINRALVSGPLVQVRRGWLAANSDDAERKKAIAVARANPCAVLSHRSAALMHRLPIVGARATVPEVTVLPRGPGNITGAHVHRATLLDADIVLIDGVAVTSVARTLVDLARHRATACSVAAIDAALHKQLVTFGELEEILLRCWNWPRIRRAQRVTRLVDARAESPLESVSRLVIRWLRLPPPEPQVTAFDQRGYPAGRLDFYWDEYGVAGESDGKAKYDNDPTEYDKEKERQEYLEDHRLVFVRWGWDQPWRHPHLLKSKLLNGFERGLARDRSGLPRLWSVRQCDIGPDGGKRDQDGR